MKPLIINQNNNQSKKKVPNQYLKPIEKTDKVLDQESKDIKEKKSVPFDEDAFEKRADEEAARLHLEEEDGEIANSDSKDNVNQGTPKDVEMEDIKNTDEEVKDPHYVQKMQNFKINKKAKDHVQDPNEEEKELPLVKQVNRGFEVIDDHEVEQRKEKRSKVLDQDSNLKKLPLRVSNQDLDQKIKA